MVVGRIWGEAADPQDWPDVSSIKEDCECLGAVAMLLSLTLCMCEFPKTFKGRVYI